MTPWLDDGDVRLYHGDALETLRGLPDGSVDCVVTSPPYWGLRDYQTKGQLGLEPTPDLFVTNMVAVFREVRRVLADHGTCWVNLGDSYAGTPHYAGGPRAAQWGENSPAKTGWELGTRRKIEGPGLKPKDLVGIPWRVAFALQADGWWLRSDIIWSKPNPMPESVTDRPTKAHEYVFLLTKRPRYFFDTEAVREPHTPDGRHVTTVQGGNGSIQHRDGERWPNAGRNVRSVWNIATQPYPEAHFATFPEELARRCILAGCPTRVCRVCGKPSERIVEPEEEYRALLSQRQRPAPLGSWLRAKREAAGLRQSEVAALFPSRSGGLTGCVSNWELDKNIPTPEQWEVLKEVLSLGSEKDALLDAWHEWERSWASGGLERGAGANKTVSATRAMQSIGWSDCGHNNWRPGVALDPFIGSGTVANVARDHQRHAIGIDLSQSYLELAARRLQQLSLLNEASV